MHSLSNQKTSECALNDPSIFRVRNLIDCRSVKLYDATLNMTLGCQRVIYNPKYVSLDDFKCVICGTTKSLVAREYCVYTLTYEHKISRDNFCDIACEDCFDIDIVDTGIIVDAGDVGSKIISNYNYVETTVLFDRLHHVLFNGVMCEIESTVKQDIFV